MKINNNMSAVIANGQLKKAENRLASSVERLSSGLRINRAGDDPAGMAISQKMKTQIRGLGRASDNASDGVSVIETAEGALTEVHSILNRMRELAVQSANGVYTAEDRESIQKEITSLQAEVDRIANDTEFNGVNLLDGSLDYRGYTSVKEVSVITFSDTVPEGDYVIKVVSAAERAEVTTGNEIQAITSKAQEGSLMINGETVKFEVGDTQDEVLQKIRSLANRVGISVTAQTQPFTDIVTGEITEEIVSCTFTTDQCGSAAKIELKCENPQLAAALGITSGTVAYGKDTVVDLGQNFSKTASYVADGTRVQITDRNGFSMELDIEETVKPDVDVTLDIMHIGAMNLQIGANEDEVMKVKIPATTTYALDIDYLNYLSQEGSEHAITDISNAVSRVSSVRASLGAYQNRLEHAISSLDVSEVNMTSAMSRIEDVDMAEEMSEYTAASVIQQAGISVLGQANDVPQMVLQLLN